MTPAGRRSRLEQLRKSMGLTQAEVAARVGISRSAYTMIESGARNPRMSLQKRLADLFGVTVDELFFGSEGHEVQHYSDRPAACQ